MCTRPQYIPNQNYRTKSKNKWYKYKDTESQYLAVPCGHCEECIAVKQMGYVQRIMLESMKYEVFMIMYSYKDSMLPKLEVNGYTFKYANIQDFILMTKRFEKWRKENDHRHTYIKYPFRYFGVTEKGEKKGRPHFHILIFIEKKYLPTKADCLNYASELWHIMLDNWQRNTGSTRKPIYENLCEYHERWRNGILERNFDCKYIDPGATINGIGDTAWYCMKYILKDADKEEKRRSALKLNLDENQYLKIWNTIKNKNFHSQYFGLNAEKSPFGDLYLDEEMEAYVRKGIEYGKGIYDYPVFINPNTGKTFPLCKFLRNYCMTEKDMEQYYNPDKMYYSKYSDDYKGTSRANSERKGKRVKAIHEMETLDEALNELNFNELCQ